jgi:hypothetical protein
VEVWDGAAWIPTHYDSGWRDITASITTAAGITPYKFLIRRVDTTVFVTVQVSAALPIAWGDIFTGIPAGFRPATVNDMQRTMRMLAFGNQTSWQNGGNLRAFRDAAAWQGSLSGSGTQTLYMDETLPTNDPIPSSLPGTLVTTAP